MCTPDSSFSRFLTFMYVTAQLITAHLASVFFCRLKPSCIIRAVHHIWNDTLRQLQHAPTVSLLFPLQLTETSIFCSEKSDDSGWLINNSNLSPSSLYLSPPPRMIYCFACREGRTPPTYIFISAPRRAHVVFLLLINRLRSVVSPPTLRTGSLPKGLAGKWRAGAAYRSWPKVYNLKPFGSGSEPRRKGKDEGKESDRDRKDAGQRHGKVAFSCVLHDAIKSHRAFIAKIFRKCSVSCALAHGRGSAGN